jgi:hypothetical protein
VRFFYQGFSFLILICLAHTGFSQRISNLTYIMQVNEGATKYLINYDLQSTFDNVPSRVNVKLTIDINGMSSTFYLKEVSGDVGDFIYPGPNKKIVWDYQKELIHFSGDINLVVESAPIVMVSHKIKRGSEVTVSLPGFETAEKYIVKLFQRGNEIAQLTEGTLKDGTLSVSIPKKSKIRSKYQLAIEDIDKSYFSNSFKIRRKFSLGWIIVPAIGVSAYLVISKSLEANEPLPGPPGSGTPNN